MRMQEKVNFAGVGPAVVGENNSRLCLANLRCRYEASRDDLAVYAALSGVPDASEFPNAARWYNHINARLGARCGPSSSIHLPPSSIHLPSQVPLEHGTHCCGRWAVPHQLLSHVTHKAQC